jgi:hypothetical protein
VTASSTCRACLRDQHHRCVGWCACPLAHKTTTPTPAPKAARKAAAPRAAKAPAAARAPRTNRTPAPTPAPVAAPAPEPKRFKPRHRSAPVARAAVTDRQDTAQRFLAANAWSPAALQLLAAVDGRPIDPAATVA